jgi:hypothetical protein
MSEVLNPTVTECALNWLFASNGTALVSSLVILIGLACCLRRR